MSLEDSLNSSGVSYTKLQGAFGSFSPLKGGAVVRYMQTALSYEDNAEKQILDEIRPFRDIVQPMELKSVDHLIQRDLNDLRVAEKLMKYLTQHSGERPVFFPGALIFLYPKKYSRGGSYPDPKDADNGSSTEYGELWKLEKLSNRIARLHLNTSATDFMIIDGQHRVTAFQRVFDADARQSDSKFDAFYLEREAELRGLRKNAQNLMQSADLPVTFVWFDGGSQFDLLEYSREIFLDVNQGAENVSRSRNILLSESGIIERFTRRFYDFFARKDWAGNQLSLFNLGVDFPKDVRGRLQVPPGVFTVPEIVNAMMKSIFFSPVRSRWNLNWEQGSDRSEWKNFQRFTEWSEVLKVKSDEEDNMEWSVLDSELSVADLFEITTPIDGPQGLRLASSKKKEEFQDVSEKVAQLLARAFSVVPYYQSLNNCIVRLIEHWDDDRSAGSSTSDVSQALWMCCNQVIKSGDAFYYALRAGGVPDSLKEKRALVDKIEAEYGSEVEQVLGDRLKFMRSAYLLLGTGMAFDWFMKRYGKLGPAEILKKWDAGMAWLGENLMEKLSLFDACENLELHLRARGELNAKSWGYARAILLRLLSECPDLSDLQDEPSSLEFAMARVHFDYQLELFAGDDIELAELKSKVQESEKTDKWDDNVISKSDVENIREKSQNIVTELFASAGIDARFG